MSSTIAEVEKSTKKRKHEGDGMKAKPKKKRRHAEEAEAEAVVQPEVEEVVVAREERKEEKQMRREKRKNETVGSEHGEDEGQQEVSVYGDTEPSSASRKEKKKKRKHKEAEAEAEAEVEVAVPQPPELESTREDDAPAVNGQEDEEMRDAPAVEDDLSDTQDKPAMEEAVDDTMAPNQLQSDEETSFHSIRMSLYLPIPAVASSSSLSAMLALHLSPLLLTFFPPVEGVILSYHDPAVSAQPEPGPSRPLLAPITSDESRTASASDETLVRLGEELGASWAWLTVTFLVFKPQPGEELQGSINAMSEGFVGLVSYNYFQSSISKQRIPRDWLWDRPSRERERSRKTPRKGKLNDGDGPSQESYGDSQETLVIRDDDAIDGIAGSFVDGDGEVISENLQFRVVDLEMIPAQERGQSFALQLEGTLLDEDGEEAVRQEEREKWEARLQKGKSRSRTPGTPMMSGGLPMHSRAGSVVSTP